jgi:ferrochelatase
MSRRLAVVLFNLGGPDTLESVQPFLFNLFNDKAIFNLPRPFRGWLAAFVAKRRAPIASEIYRQLGGGSPLLANTVAQADALHAALGGGPDTRVFIAMRYWHPFTAQTAADVQDWRPDEIILLPLYPQFSTTTAASSLGAWRDAAKSLGLKVPARTICCYPTAPGFIAAMAEAIAPALDQAAAHGTPRLLLSAHGLPEKVVANGDPYQYQCEQTAQAIVAAIAERRSDYADLDWSVCYQSRVGPLKWIQPSTDEEIRRAGQDRAPVVIAPIAFVSEHSETLVEIEIEYRALAAEAGVPCFVRVPAAATAPAFIDALARLVRRAQTDGSALISGCGGRFCPPVFKGCPLAN